MCREKNNPNARRCPSSLGELRNARDRANYQMKVSAGKTSPVDPVLTAAPTPIIPISLEDAAASVREDMHSLYHYTHNKNLGYSQYDPESGEGRVSLNWRTVEENVRNVGAAVEDRASEIAGFTAEDVAERHHARAQLVTERATPLAEALAATSNELRTAEFELYKMKQGSDENSFDAELEARVDALTEKAKSQEAALDEAIKQIATECGFENVDSLDTHLVTRKIAQGGDPATVGESRTLAEARLAALKEIRDFGGVEIETSEKSSKRVNAVMAEVADYYPTDWIAKSNEKGDLRVKDTKGRAHYNQNATQRVRTQMTETRWAKDGEKPDGDEWVRGVYTGSGWANPLTNPDAAEKYADYAGMEDANVMWVRPAFKTRRAMRYYAGESVEGKPPRGWVEAYETIGDGTTIRVFRQPAWRMTSGESTAELTVDRDNNMFQWQETNGLSTALHEFGHRAEHTNPQIFTLEEAFLKRRTTDSDGNRENLQPIYRSRNEMARFDSFADKYMGKEYTHEYREVLSTGMEALFAGQFGGLAGIDGKTPDADMRAFILGVLATA